MVRIMNDKKNTYVRRDLVDEQVNQKENISDDKKTSLVVLPDTFPLGDREVGVIGRNLDRSGCGESHPDYYLG